MEQMFLFLTCLFLFAEGSIDSLFQLSDSLGLLSAADTRGIAVVDVDQDGFFDAVVAVQDGPNLVLQYNRSNGRYEDVASTTTGLEALRDATGRTTSVCACDLDGDGIEEIYLNNHNDVYQSETTGSRAPDRMLKYHNGRYIDVFSFPENSELAPQYGGQSAACLDHTGDGKCAFLVTTYRKDGRGTYRLFVHDQHHPAGDLDSGKIILADVSKQTGFDKTRVGWGITAGQFLRGDPTMTVYITNDNSNYIGSDVYRHDGANILMRNNGSGSFRDKAPAAGIDDRNMNGRGVSVGDLNQDGDVDILHVNWYGPGRIYLQNHTLGSLLYETVPDTVFSHSAPADILLLADLGSNGGNAILQGLVDGHTYHVLYAITQLDDNATNNRKPVNISSVHNTGLPNVRMHGVTFADINGDDQPELIISHEPYNSRTLSVYRTTTLHNNRANNNWIRILPLTQSGAPARGMTVRLSLEDLSERLVVIDGACSYRCQTEPVAHFNIGARVARAVSLTWPDGHSVTIRLYKEQNRRTLLIGYTGSISVKGDIPRPTDADVSRTDSVRISRAMLLTIIHIYVCL